MKTGGRQDRERSGSELVNRVTYVRKLIVLAVIYGFSILMFIPVPGKGLEAVFLDVGQGDGILLRTKKTAILIDGGSSSKKSLGEYSLEPCLKSLGISTIRYAFISHGDQDHLSGVEYLLESCEDIRIENIILPYHGREDNSIKKLAKLAKGRGTRVGYIVSGDKISVEGLYISCLYPKVTDVPEDTNGESQVLRVDYGNCHMLFTGDMGILDEERILKRREEKRLLSGINVLKVSHHGSRYSSGELFLDAIKPQWAIVSYGEGNPYGHPHMETLKRYSQRNVPVFKTAKKGAIQMWTDGKRIRFTSFVDGKNITRYNK